MSARMVVLTVPDRDVVWILLALERMQNSMSTTLEAIRDDIGRIHDDVQAQMVESLLADLG